ncbi:MAG: class I SAM-dependent methyltransferase [Desulfovibrio sp.]|nr:class I SAM-dependent methyltransferase [Desulfovibrio sp.]
MAHGGKNGAAARLFAGKGPISSYVFIHQLNLLGAALPQARGASLLEVNCGDGSFFSLYRKRGFDLAAVEPNPVLRAQAREANRMLEIYPATADHLPYEDNAIDWIVLHLRDEIPEKCARECMRVAEHGILLTFWNSASLAAYCWKIGGRAKAWPWPANTGTGLWRMLNGLGADHLESRSTLLGPVASWKRECSFSFINRLPGRTLLGAWCVIRADFNSPGLATPLGLRIRSGMPKPVPAMEYSQKNISGCQKDVTDS